MQPVRGSAPLALLGVLLLAINLRPAITAVGPVITNLGADLNLSAAELGLLGALPLATFGLVSGGVQVLLHRFAVERVTAGALFTLTAATLLRSWPGPNANLWVGTILIAAAIAVGNVSAPVLVKRSFPTRTASMTSIYVAVLGLSAGLAAALAVPIANLSPLGWRLALGGWAALSAIALGYWLLHAVRTPRMSGGQSTPLGGERAGLWRSPVTWWLSAYMGVQSSVFFVSLTWLPAVEQHLGISPVAAGLHMLVLQAGGVAGNLSAPTLMRLGGDERSAAILPGVLAGAAIAGFYFLPGLAVLWVALLGVGTGATFVVALSLMAIRAPSLAAASVLSAITQSVGYLIASVILFVAGIAAGNHPLNVLAVLLFAALCVVGTGIYAGRRQLAT